MEHGNKIYFFEKLENIGDTLIVKPRPAKVRVNINSLKQAIKSYKKENIGFDCSVEEHKNGNATITRTK